MNLLHTY